jgi:hypothetical protein
MKNCYKMNVIRKIANVANAVLNDLGPDRGIVVVIVLAVEIVKPPIDNDLGRVRVIDVAWIKMIVNDGPMTDIDPDRVLGAVTGMINFIWRNVLTMCTGTAWLRLFSFF